MTKFIERLTKIIRFPLLLVIVLMFTGIIQYVLMVKDVQGVHYDLKLFQVSPETIRSVKTVEDTKKTEKDRQQAATDVEAVYVYSEEKGKNQISMVNTFFDDVEESKQIIEGKSKKQQIAEKDKQVQRIQDDIKKLSSENTKFNLSDVDIMTLLEQNTTDIQKAKTEITSALASQMSVPIREDRLNDAKDSIERTIRYSSTFPSDLKEIGMSLARSALVVNESKDAKATEESIEQAKANVDPTRILQGQIIVQEGQVIDRDVYHQLELSGLLSEDVSKKPLLGLALLIILQLVLFFSVFYANKTKSDSVKIRDLMITMLVYLLSMVLMELLDLVDGEFDIIIGFLFPTAIAPLLIRILVNERMAILITVALGLSAGIVFQEGYSTVMQMEIALYLIISGLACVLFMRKMISRTKILTVSLQVAAVNMLFISSYLLLTQSNYKFEELLFYLLAAVVSAVVSGALAMGLLPFIESAFGIISSYRLIELSNPNHPLLKKILMEAPGTYHHSLMVANLADAACEAVGANGLLARVGCYYHDIGKTRRPGFFVENQMNGFNPHDQLPPEASSDIIIAHVIDGVKILQKHKMPKEIIDIAAQHHGTSLVKFFYFKAKELDPDVSEEKYRYSGPKPQTKENAIISIADSVEAAVRSMKEPNAEKIKSLIHAITQDKLMDEQFDECDLSIKELKTIEKVFGETLNGTFHSRIEYPK
ncbi:MAG: HD family phosphohydrolase [Kurthia sp.]|nr:HD family phosphohydrolase [Candidatus Kurthia equi]